VKGEAELFIGSHVTVRRKAGKPATHGDICSN
jgi:hypothetical protein